MNLTETDIDRIVGEVVRRLRAMMATSSTEGRVRESLGANDVPNGNHPNRQRLPTPVHSSELKLSDKVITLQSLKGRLDGVAKVIVTDRAIVTPAVKDELRDRKIAWERAAGGRGQESLAASGVPSSQVSDRQRLPTPVHSVRS